MAIIGCGRQGATVAAQSSPTAAMSAYYDAAKKNDGAALKKLVSSASLKMLQNPDVPVERVLVAMNNKVPQTRPEIRNEKIVGDRATLEVRRAETNAWDTVIFVHEEGAWKMALDEMDKARTRR
jgi:hypothetical protein